VGQVKADGDRRGREVRLPDPRLRGDEDGDVVEEGPVPELKLSEAQAPRRIFHIPKLTLPRALLHRRHRKKGLKKGHARIELVTRDD